MNKNRKGAGIAWKIANFLNEGIDLRNKWNKNEQKSD